MFSHTRSLQIEWGHCDPAGIVFNPRYFEFFDWNTALLFERALGMTKAQMLKAHNAVGIPLVDTRARFLRPVAYGETVEITSTMAKLGRSSFDVHHRLLHRSELAVEGSETRVWVGRNPENLAGLKSQPIPAEIAEKLSAGG